MSITSAPQPTHPLTAMSTVQICPTLELDLPAEAFPGFASLLQHGVLFPIEKSTPLLALLVTLPGFSAEYIEKNVQTIFINGVAADSLNKEMVDGTTVALSAAMPGLAGAIFRRQGVHGSLRSKQVTDAPLEQSGAGFLTLKFFNSIATDRVADLLQKGILVSGKALVKFARMRGHLFEPPIGLKLDGEKVAYADLLGKAENWDMVRVQLKE